MYQTWKPSRTIAENRLNTRRTMRQVFYCITYDDIFYQRFSNDSTGGQSIRTAKFRFLKELYWFCSSRCCRSTSSSKGDGF